MESMKEVKLTREELYNLVWSESLLSLSKKYVISDVGLRKKCIKMAIPLPDLGYWTCVQFGKKLPSKKPLPESKGDNCVILMLREEGDNKDIDSNIVKLSTLIEEVEKDSRLNLKVPERLTNPDKIIISVKDDLYKKHIWRKDDSVVTSSSGFLSISVNPKNVSRALRLLDTLIKALRFRGHNFANKNGNVYVVIGEEEMMLSCREKHSKEIIKEKYGDRTITKPNGILSIRMEESYNVKEWIDGKILLEEQLSKIIASIELKGLKLKEERIAREKYWAEQKEKDRIAKELQDRKEKELNDFKEIFRMAQRHEKAEAIRRYAQKFENWIISKSTMTDELLNKIEWMRKKADWYDPFIEAYDELLNDIDREELKLTKQLFPWLK